MKLTQRTAFWFLLTFFSVFKTQGQIAGTFSVPATFPTIAAAINTLNTMGVAGHVTIYVSAGHTETATVGGYKLYAIAGAASTAQVVFQKSGVGANPIIYAYSGGIATPTSSIQDGVWWLIGADYVTIDGIDITDPNTSNPSTMEFGYGLYNVSTSDGCQYNTIKNCVVTLNRINAATGSGLNAGGSRGIESVCASYTANVTTYTPTSASGTHSYNKFYSNLIQNCHNGITLMGHQAASPYTLSDKQNDIGGTSAVTGNTVINFGGGTGTINVSGIRTKAQYSLNVSYNTLNNNNGSGSDPAFDVHAINLGSGPGANTTVNGNTITLNVISTNSVDAYGIRNASGSASATMQITNNVFPSGVYTGTNGGMYLIYDNSTSALVNVSNNLSQNITGNYVRMIQTANSSTCSVTSNTCTNFNLTSTLYGILSGDHGNLIISNNRIENIYADRSVNAITDSWGTTVGSSTLSLNSVGNFTTAEGWGLSSGSFSVTKTISGNTVSNVFSPPTTTIAMDFTGINVRGGSASIIGNSIHTFTGAAASSTYTFQKLEGIGLESINNARVERNKIGSFTSVSKGAVHGIYLLTSPGHTIANNVIGDLNALASNRSDGLVGIYLDGSGSSSNLYYYNTVYLNSASTSTGNFGSAAIIFPTSGNIQLRNNILVNMSVSTGTGITTVIRKPNTTLSYYLTSSNNNILYAGTPSANRYLFHDGVNTFTTLADLKTYATPRESASFSENPPFITTTGALSNFLSLNPSVPTTAESGASAITGFTTDYSGATRSSTPDIGAWEGNYTQADLFSPSVTATGFTSSGCDITGRTLTVNITDASGVATGSLSPRLYYRVNFGLYSSTQGSLSSGTYTNGVWTFSLSYSANASDVIRYFLALQDVSTFTNITTAPAGGSLTSVNNITTFPATTYTFALESPPNISVSNASICSGSNFTINPGGASTYTISGGSFIVSPTVSTSYSITGTSTAGCVSASAAIAMISVQSSPTISINSGSICTGKSFTFNPSGADTYTITGGSFIVSPSANASYTVTGTNTLGGCVSAPVSGSVEVFTTPTVAVSSGSICFGNTYIISPSGAFTYTVSGGTATVSPTTNTFYTVTGSSTAGCVSANTATATLTVAPLPTISAGNGTICSGKSFTINPTGASTYTYSDGSAIVSPLTNTFYTVSGTSSLGCVSANAATVNVLVNASPSISVNSGSICSGSSFTIIPSDVSLTYTYSGGSAIVSPITNTLYTVVGTNSLGCVSNSATSNVTVYASPTIGVNSGSICAGNTFTILPSGGASYNISGGSAVVSPATNTVYLVTGTSSVGCVSANTATATVTVAPLPTLSASNGTICSGKSFTISPTGASTYTYSGGSAIVSPLTSTVYTFSGTSSVGCLSSNTASVNITVLASPSITVNSGAICSGNSFTIVPSDGSLTYTYSGGSSVVSPGTSTVYSVVGSNIQGCVSNSATSNVTVNATPTISVNSGTICLGSTFTINPTGANTYCVQGGSYNVSPSSSSTYTVFGVSLEGCPSATTALSSVTVIPLPTISAAGGLLCTGSVFTFSPTGAATYIYSSGSATVAPVNTSTYTISGLSPEGCQSSNTVVVTVSMLPLPTLSITGNTLTCAGVTQTLSVTGANTYTWMAAGNGSIYVVSPGATTSYTVVGSGLGSCTNTAQITITTNSLPVLAISGNTAVCSGLPANLSVSGTAITFTWSNGTIGNLASFSPTLSTVVTATGTGVNGCINTATQVIFVNSLPPVLANADNNPICIGESVTLFGSGASSYTWTGGVGNNTAFYPSSTNTYTLSGTDANGCKNSSTIQVVVNALPNISINSMSPDTVCEGDEIILIATGGNFYSWTSGQITNSVAVSPALVNGYTVTGTDANGCKSTANFVQYVEECTGIRKENVLAGLKIYPNPNNGLFYIEYEKTIGNLRLELNNLLGETILSYDLDGANEIRLKENAKGVYFVRIYSGTRLLNIEKIVVAE